MPPSKAVANCQVPTRLSTLVRRARGAGLSYFFALALCAAQRRFWASEMALRALADIFRRFRLGMGWGATSRAVPLLGRVCRTRLTAVSAC